MAEKGSPYHRINQTLVSLIPFIFLWGGQRRGPTHVWLEKKRTKEPSVHMPCQRRGEGGLCKDYYHLNVTFFLVSGN